MESGDRTQVAQQPTRAGVVGGVRKCRGRQVSEFENPLALPDVEQMLDLLDRRRGHPQQRRAQVVSRGERLLELADTLAAAADDERFPAAGWGERRGELGLDEPDTE